MGPLCGQGLMTRRGKPKHKSVVPLKSMGEAGQGWLLWVLDLNAEVPWMETLGSHPSQQRYLAVSPGHPGWHLDSRAWIWEPATATDCWCLVGFEPMLPDSLCLAFYRYINKSSLKQISHVWGVWGLGMDWKQEEMGQEESEREYMKKILWREYIFLWQM